MIYGFILGAVEDVPESRMTDQPGDHVNHPAWALSHLNAYAGFLLTLLGDPSVPTADKELEQFGYGTTPVPDPKAYATKQRLLEAFKARNERLTAVVAEVHAERFPQAAPERYQPHSPTVGHLAVTLLVAHPADHFGQLRHWRRVAGISAPSAGG